jgi:hypothetical protein
MAHNPLLLPIPSTPLQRTQWNGKLGGYSGDCGHRNSPAPFGGIRLWSSKIRDPDIEAAFTYLAMLLAMQGITLPWAVLGLGVFPWLVIRRVMGYTLMSVVRINIRYCEFQHFFILIEETTCNVAQTESDDFGGGDGFDSQDSLG